MSRWKWGRPEGHGHERQPLIEWWIERLAVAIVLIIGRRAHRRGDQRTFMRMLAVSLAGSDAEMGASALNEPFGPEGAER